VERVTGVSLLLTTVEALEEKPWDEPACPLAGGVDPGTLAWEDPGMEVASTVDPRELPDAPVDTRLERELRDILAAIGLAAGANVIMQLSLLPVGHGVARSAVDSGRVDKHPLKRARTTGTFLVVALLGDAEDRRGIRDGINRVHALVRSSPGDPVAYNAFDPQLQLWVAGCLWKGVEDIYRLQHPVPDPARLDALYRHAARLGTTLQVPEEMWPADRETFAAYWERGLRRIAMDDPTREYLQGIADMSFVVAPLGAAGKPLRWLLRPVGRFFAVGFLQQPFRDELRLPWSKRRPRRFETVVRFLVAVIGRVPRRLRDVPTNVLLGDCRRRIRRGRPII
jgi:uncharacterized protein (DUF2236 family)